MWQGKVGGDFPLESSWNNLVERERKRKKRKEKERKEKKRKRKKRKERRKKRRVRSSTLSLGFTEIGPSVFVGARGKVHLRDESFA